MRQPWIWIMSGVLACLPCLPGVARAQFPVGWSQIPNTRLRPLQPSSAQSLGNFTGMLEAWVGAAVDTKRGWWIVPLGGGDQDWAGNETYVVDLVTRTSSLLLPSSPNSRLGIECADPRAEEPDPGRPGARHTYDQVVYAPATDEVWVFFGAKECRGGFPSQRVWRLNLKTRTWTGFSPPGSGGNEWKGANMARGMDHAGVTAYDRVTQKIYYHNRNQMFVFDPRTVTATPVGEGLPRALNQNAVIDPWRRKLVLLGNTVAAGGGLIVFDLVKQSYARPATTEARPGDKAAETTGGLGVAWDPVTTRVVAWAGGPRLYFLDLDTMQWASEELPLNGGIAAPSASGNGVFSKFDYVPQLGCFVVMTRVDADMSVACPSTARPLPGRITIPLQTFWAAPRPPAGVGPAGGMKHNTYAHNPLDGRMYQFGGDFTELSPVTGRPSNQSYVQSGYSLSVHDKWANRTDPRAGWRQDWPFCGPPGSLQPKYPDYVGWAWDPRSRRFITVPGTYDLNTDPDYRCPGETASTTSDPQFRRNHVMAFDPAKPLPQRWAILSADAGAVGGDGPWMGALDPVTNRVYRFNAASQVQSFDLATKTWSRPASLPSDAVGQPVRIWKEQLAVDEVGRAIYAIDGVAGRLMRYLIDPGRMQDLGPVPGGQIAGGSSSNDALVAWDSTNAVLVFFRNGDRTIHVYDPAAQKWSSPPVVVDGASAVDVRHAFAYDPYQNVIVLLGTTDTAITQLFFWRYGDPRASSAGARGTASPGAPPAPRRDTAAAKPDAELPRVSLTAPAPGETVRGSVTVTATASDDQELAGVQFNVDGTNLGAEDTASPYSAEWHTASSGAGAHTVTAVARDSAGNTATSASVTVAAQVMCPCTIWPASTAPSMVNDADAQAVEVGVRFTVDVDGHVTAIRFYKGPQNAGPHIGSLWKADGTLLAQVTFAREAASGWQEQPLPKPVAIQANTVFVASYHTTVGRYSADTGYFTAAAANNSPLHAPATGSVPGGNGVFRYSGVPAFPDQTHGGNNYWVDVVFVPSGGRGHGAPEPTGEPPRR